MCLFKDIGCPCDHPECEIVMSIFINSTVYSTPRKISTKYIGQTMSSSLSKQQTLKRMRSWDVKQLEQDQYFDNPEEIQPQEKQQKLSNRSSNSFNSIQSQVQQLKKQLNQMRNNQILMMRTIEQMSDQMSKLLQLHLKHI